MIPTNCPTCNSELSWEGVHLICSSPRCITQLIKSIEYFYSDKGMEVKSIGEFMLGDIIEQPQGYHILSSRPYALLEPETFGLDGILLATWGEKKYKTYRENLAGLSKNPVHFISALGYDKLAYKTALKLWYYVFGNLPLTSVAKTAQKNFIDAFIIFETAKKEMKRFTFLPVPPIPKITYCITGKLSISRTEMIAYLEKYKWSFSNQVSRHTDILIVGEEPGETKTTKARELNILTINESEIGGRL